LPRYVLVPTFLPVPRLFGISVTRYPHITQVGVVYLGRYFEAARIETKFVVLYLTLKFTESHICTDVRIISSIGVRVRYNI